MLKKFLKDVVVSVVGKQAEPIADLLNSTKHVNEFIIAKKLDLTINQTRNILYKISDQGLVSFIRKKDKKKGWYTYFWKIEVLKSLEFLKEILFNKIDQINNQIKSRETKQFYFCHTCNVEYSEENALLHDFTCPECGNVFTLKDNASLVKDMKKSLIKLTAELGEVQQEIDQEREKVGKKKDKDNKKIEKDTKKRKQEARKKTISLKKELNDKNIKKNPTPIKIKKPKKSKYFSGPKKKIKKKISKK
jgi:transcription initiation factor TFIIE subunit alpha